MLVDRRRHRRRVVDVDEPGRDPEPREGVGEEGVGPAVERRRRDDRVARLGQVQDRERLGRLAARRRHRRHASLERRRPAARRRRSWGS